MSHFIFNFSLEKVEYLNAFAMNVEERIVRLGYVSTFVYYFYNFNANLRYLFFTCRSLNFDGLSLRRLIQMSQLQKVGTTIFILMLQKGRGLPSSFWSHVTCNNLFALASYFGPRCRGFTIWLSTKDVGFKIHGRGNALPRSFCPIIFA